MKCPIKQKNYVSKKFGHLSKQQSQLQNFVSNLCYQVEEHWGGIGYGESPTRTARPVYSSISERLHLNVLDTSSTSHSHSLCVT